MIAWHTIPFDADDVPRGAPSCNDGEEILVRIDGETVPVTCYRDQRGHRIVDDEGEAVDWSRVDAIAHRPRPSRSGSRLTEADYRAAGLRVLKIRIPADYLAKLDAICDDSGLSRAEQVMGMIDGESAELARLRWKRTAT
jgi:hypothetical protein